MPELILTFDWDGESIHKETKGFQGKSCEDITKFVEECLKARDMKRTRKESYYVQSKSDEDKRKKPRLLSGLTT